MSGEARTISRVITMMRRWAVPAILLSLATVACDDDDEPVAPPPNSDRITIVNPPAFLNEGDTFALMAEVLDDTGAVDTLATVTWVSSRPDLASIVGGDTLAVHAAAPEQGSVDVTLRNPSVVTITARTGGEATRHEIELRGWRYARVAPGLGIVSPIVTRASEERFAGDFSSGSIPMPGEPVQLRLVCTPAGALTVALEAPGEFFLTGTILVRLDDGVRGTFDQWAPREDDDTDGIVDAFTLAPAQAVSFAEALASSSTMTMRVTLTTDTEAPRTLNFRVNGFQRFWTGPGALLSACR